MIKEIIFLEKDNKIKTKRIYQIHNNESVILSDKLINIFGLVGNETLIFKVEYTEEAWRSFAKYINKKISRRQQKNGIQNIIFLTLNLDEDMRKELLAKIC